MISKLLQKDSDKEAPMSDMHRDAKISVIKNLRDLAAKSMKDGLKKVTVAATDKKGLEKGLETAKEITSEMPNGDESSEMEEDAEDMELPQEEMSEELTPEAIDAKIQELLKLKQELEAK